MGWRGRSLLLLLAPQLESGCLSADFVISSCTLPSPNLRHAHSLSPSTSQDDLAAQQDLFEFHTEAELLSRSLSSLLTPSFSTSAEQKKKLKVCVTEMSDSVVDMLVRIKQRLPSPSSEVNSLFCASLLNPPSPDKSHMHRRSPI